MAINQNSIWNLKYFLFITFVFFIFSFTPVACTTEYFEKSASQQYHDDYYGDQLTLGWKYTNVLMFNDIDTLSAIQSISLKVDKDYFYTTGGDSEWDNVEYHLGSPTGTLIGTGTFGYNKGANYVFVIATFDDGNTFGDYSGTQKVHIVGGCNFKFSEDSSYTRGSTLYDGSSPTLVHLGHEYSAGSYMASAGPVAAGNAVTAVYTGYNFINTYTYYNDGVLNKLDVLRTGNQSMWTVERGGSVLFNDTDYETADLPVYDNDLVNNTWDITCNDSYGNTYTDTIDMAYTPPQAEDTILWGADSYVVDDTGSYSWALSDSNWDTIWYSKKASIYRDETMVHEVSLPAQTGTFYYTFEEEGTFTVKLRHTSALLPHVTIDSDTVSVTPIGESFIAVTNTTVYINTPIGFQFSYGFTPSTAYQTGIEARKLIDGNWIPVNYWDLQSSISGNITAYTLYDYTLAITGHHADSPLSTEGEYMFWLQDADKGDVANTNIYIVEYQAGAPTENITTTYLDITSGESYLMISEIAYNYGIDNTNFSTGTNYFEMYNYDYNQVTQSALLSRQTAYEWGTLYPVGVYEPSESYYWGGLVALPGNNSMRIRHDDLNGSTILVYDNFTLSELNPGGYGLKLSTYEACINDPVTISVTIPSASNLTIFSPYGVEIITYNMNASGTIIYYFPVMGLYTIKLIPNGSIYEEAMASIFISDCADDGIIEPPSGEMDDMYINMFNAMTIPAFWGMIIFIGFIGGLAIKRDKNGDALVSGNGLAFIAFGLLNLLSIIGLFAPYTFYIIVSTWIFAGMFFGVGRYLARGEG